MKTYYRHVVIGGTYYGCGLAAVDPENTLVVEPSILVGSDFSMNFNPGTQWDYMPSHPDTFRFRNELEQRNVINDGKVHQPAMTPVFSKWCLDAGLHVALASNVLEYDEHSMTLFDANGRHEVSFDRITDARPVHGKTKRITASIFTDSIRCGGDYGIFQIVDGLFDSEAFLLIDIADTTSWPEARLTLFNVWQERPEKLSRCSVAAVGVRFDYNNFSNPLVALDRGLGGGNK
ncbi:MAG: hypothetical protein JXR78_03725 [Victivallales bacterium]|nr:hypothetical protein [Victivallales bacterium]